MIIALTIAIGICCLFLLYLFIKVLGSRRNIIYIGDRDKALVYTEGDLKIIGKPDYIKREDNNYVPYEYKSLKIKSNAAYLDHKLQLACYMRLIEKTFNQKPGYGVITYGNKKTFKVDNTPQLQEQLEKRIGRLKELKTGKAMPARNHHIHAKCFACRYYSACKYRLGRKKSKAISNSYQNSSET